MGRFGKIIRRPIDFQYALGEFLLIFLGITMAIWFNNWNADRKASIQEEKSLREVLEALRLDLEDVQENIAGFRSRQQVYDRFIAALEEEGPIPEEVQKYLGVLHGWTIFISNSGAYETLKSRGMETIQNDSVRQAISYYYQIINAQIKTTEEVYKDHFFGLLKPKLFQEFELQKLRMVIRDLDELRNDFEFNQILSYAAFYEKMMLQLYEGTETEITSLIARIEEELTHF